MLLVRSAHVWLFLLVADPTEAVPNDPCDYGVRLKEALKEARIPEPVYLGVSFTELRLACLDPKLIYGVGTGPVAVGRLEQLDLFVLNLDDGILGCDPVVLGCELVAQEAVHLLGYGQPVGRLLQGL